MNYLGELQKAREALEGGAGAYLFDMAHNRARVTTTLEGHYQVTLSYGVQIFFKASEFPQAVSALIAYDMVQRAQEAYNQIVTLNGLDTMYKGIADDQ